LLSLGFLRARVGETEGARDEIVLEALRVIRNLVLERRDVRGEILRREFAIDYPVADTNLGMRRAVMRHTNPPLIVNERTARKHADEDVDNIVFRLLEMENNHIRGQLVRKSPEDDPRAAGLWRFEIEELITSYEFDAGRVPARALDTRRLISLVDGASDYVLGTLYSGSSESVGLEVLEGGVIDEGFDVIDSATGFRRVRIRFPRPLRAGEAHTLRVVKHVRAATPEPMPFFLCTPDEPVRKLRTRVTFADQRPTSIRKIVTLAHAFPTALREEPLELDAEGTAEAIFLQLTVGMGYGFAWTWSEQTE
jgi:hypothetical protein